MWLIYGFIAIGASYWLPRLYGRKVLEKSIPFLFKIGALDSLTSVLASSLPPQSAVRIPGTQCIEIKYEYGGIGRTIYVPYYRGMSTPSIHRQVLLHKNGEIIDITQQPGIPYFISLDMLQGESIEFLLDGVVSKVYDRRIGNNQEIISW